VEDFHLDFLEVIWLLLSILKNFTDRFIGEEEISPPENVDNKKYYELLQVEQNATFDEIKSSYKKIAL